MKLPKIITRKQITEALSNKGDFEIEPTGRELRQRFKKAICRNLFGMTAEKVQHKLWN